jgi:hypothetical protein
VMKEISYYVIHASGAHRSLTSIESSTSVLPA